MSKKKVFARISAFIIVDETDLLNSVGEVSSDDIDFENMNFQKMLTDGTLFLQNDCYIPGSAIENAEDVPEP